MTREEIYEAQIAPLIAQIVAIAREHDIPFVVSFQLDGVLHVSTLVHPEMAVISFRTQADVL